MHKGYDTQLSRFVAIKRLISQPDAERDQDEAAAVRKEAGALSQMHHPNIVSIFDVNSDEQGLFIVMEMIEGENLADWVKREPMELSDFHELVEQLLEALTYAHGEHLIHRDIKPQNIKIKRLSGGRLQVKLVDFGLARLSTTAQKQTADQSGNVLGSIYYMAPEQFLRKALDGRTDLYALACVLYEVLAGRHAFDAETVTALMDKHLNHEVVPLGELRPDLPSALCDWVMWMMNLDRAHRAPSAAAALDSFRTAVAPQIAHIETETISIHTSSAPTIPSKTVPVAPARLTSAVGTVHEVAALTDMVPVKKSGAGISSAILGVGLGVVLIGGLFFFLSHSQTPAKTPPAAVASAPSAPPESKENPAPMPPPASPVAAPPSPKAPSAAAAADASNAGIPDAVKSDKVQHYNRPPTPNAGSLALYYTAVDNTMTLKLGQPAPLTARPGEPVFVWKGHGNLGKDSPLLGIPERPETVPQLNIVKISTTQREHPVITFTGEQSLKGTGPETLTGFPFDTENPIQGVTLFQFLRSRPLKNLSTRSLRLANRKVNTTIVSLSATSTGYQALVGMKDAVKLNVKTDPRQFGIISLIWDAKAGTAELHSRDATGQTAESGSSPAPTEAPRADTFQIGEVRKKSAADPDQSPSSNQFNGDVLETLIFNRPLKPEERVNVENWLYDYYFTLNATNEQK